MTKNEFDFLRCLAETREALNEADVAAMLQISPEAVRKTAQDLTACGYLKNLVLTDVGKEALAPYRVDNAIILAAGMSTRFAPLSYERPKGLTVVKGEVVIERQIRQLIEIGVTDIVLVLGHAIEQFLYLAEKYGAKIVVNNEYKTKNTHSSIFYARDHLKNTYICCADNWFPRNLFHTYQYHSVYAAEYLDGTSPSERGVVVDADDLILSTNKPADHQWIMNGYAYMDRTFSARFKKILEDCFDDPTIKNAYWEGIYSDHAAELPLYIVRYPWEDVVEFDSVPELEAYDPDYIRHNPLALTDNICKTLTCTSADLHRYTPVPETPTERAFTFLCRGDSYIYRTPISPDGTYGTPVIEKLS